MHGRNFPCDLRDEALEVNTSKSKSDLNISYEASSTLPMIGTSDQGSVTDLSVSQGSAMDKHRNITQV